MVRIFLYLQHWRPSLDELLGYTNFITLFIRKNIFTWIQYTFMTICPTNGAITSISNPFFPTTPSIVPTPLTSTLYVIAIIPTVFTSVVQICKCSLDSLSKKWQKCEVIVHILFQILSEKRVWYWALFKKLNWWILLKKWMWDIRKK